MNNSHENLLVIVLAALVVIILCSQVAGKIAQRFGQPLAVGEITGGIVLGALLGGLWPQGGAYLHANAGQVLTVMSQLGIVLMMFQIGMEFDFELLRERRLKRALGWITLLGIPIPYLTGMFCAFIYAHYYPVPDLLGLMLICGISFSITALPILGRILLELKMENSETGVTAIAAAGINDLIGWIALGAVVVFTSGQGAAQTLLKLAAIALFLVVFFRYVRPWLIKRLQADTQHAAVLSDTHFGAIIGGVFVTAVITAWLGVFAVVGGFLVGTALYQCKALLEQWNLRMRPFVNIVLVPIFFFYTGMKVEIGSMVTAQDILWCFVWVLCACLSKGLSCTLAARLAGFSMTDSLKIGTLLNTRALMELVVLNIAHSLGLMPPQLFSILVIMALVSTLITSPLLNAIQKYSGRSASVQPVGQYS
ncbi:cation:proton antiporter [Pseudomonas corrugata]|uniref:Cation/H+ exchanger transmembrane domain-containing protein n=2 Tax=Pseudomonas TaxID=286 RepID=A0A3M3EXZ6_9PSED|nr:MULTISPECIES: cation:proton antiporter [Pseudomonas]KPW94117.1 hypothetical protein ALO79_200179 [Pseudomonas syringae pv. castaneae]MDU9033359.1 cation:proton antiporter [Pseudomonas corrugata]RMM54478.1 hypothetical protein ALQ77_02699 [Pseudomonas corrugata]UZD94499.1 cation:proton antiporter [Pseudomonas corrugata]SDU82033.1 Kef-type K+ transport system, membrane component KefB [Pseudomonas corrugata]